MCRPVDELICGSARLRHFSYETLLNTLKPGQAKGRQLKYRFGRRLLVVAAS